MWGCEGEATRPYLEATDHEHDTCPRRLVIRHPWIGSAHELYRNTDRGHLGLAGYSLANVAWEAMHVIDDAVTFAKQHREATKTE